MFKLTSLFTYLSFALLSVSTDVRRADNTSYNATCVEIAAAVSSASKVYYPGSSQYENDNAHWAASSSQSSACSFEPANVQDVGIALQILDRDQTPFGVKSGGHSAMPGFSSTPGVQISLASFSDVLYDPESETVTVGLGQVWDGVYTELDNYNVTAVGAKYTDVGIGGIVLGGGYSYLTNQYGLVIDNVVAFELVLPNGTVSDVTNDSQPDLFYGLRGGFNNFGIVTTVTLKTYPQGEVWGGYITYAAEQWDAVNLAIANFTANVSDPKASINPVYEYLKTVPAVTLFMFYGEPEYPDGIFDELLSIPHTYEDISTRSYLSLVQSFPSNALTYRAYFHWIPFEVVTTSILDMVKNQTLTYGPRVCSSSGVVITHELFLFLPSLYDHSDIPSAFPSSRGQDQGHSFILSYYGWTDSSDDELMLQLGDESAAYMKQFILDAGQDVANALVYPNCAAPDASMESMYGDALDRLHSIRSVVDPNNVMNLTGGWRF